VLRTPDPEFVAEDKNEVEITDLDSPAKTGKVLGKFPIWSQIPSFRARTWMSMAIIACIVLLFFTIQVNAPHVPIAAKVNVQPVQINYPVSLSVVDGICYTNAPNGVVTAIRISDGVVYTSAQDGQFTALRASNGIPLWKYTSLNPSQPSPAIVAEGMIFLSLQDGGMDVLRADTGILLWRYIPHVPAQRLYPQILVSDGVVYAGSHDGYLYALRASDGFTIWSVTLHTNDNLIPMNVAGGVVFVEGSLSGSVNALREDSGSVIWQYPGRAGESVPIMVVQGVVYLASYAASGVNIFASITGLRASDGVVLWSYTPQTSYKQLLPVLGNDIILIALQDGSVDALYASNGSLFWQSA